MINSSSEQFILHKQELKIQKVYLQYKHIGICITVIKWLNDIMSIEKILITYICVWMMHFNFIKQNTHIFVKPKTFFISFRVQKMYFKLNDTCTYVKLQHYHIARTYMVSIVITLLFNCFIFLFCFIEH